MQSEANSTIQIMKSRMLVCRQRSQHNVLVAHTNWELIKAIVTLDLNPWQLEWVAPTFNNIVRTFDGHIVLG